MQGTRITCDICGADKKQTNHWFVAFESVYLTGLMFVPAEDSRSAPDPAYIREDICGQECLHKRLSRWLESQTATAAAPAESVTA